MTLVILKVEIDKELSQPSAAEILQQVHNAVEKPLLDSLGKNTQVLVTSMSIDVMTRVDVKNLIHELRKISENMKK